VKMRKIKSRRVKSNVHLASRLRKQLMQASLVSEGIASNIAVDFADIASVGERHRSLLAHLQRLRLPNDLNKLEDLLISAQINLLCENDWHLKSLKKNLPKLLRSLNRRLRQQKTATETG
jgi:hypothetical protein